jgi:GNAT superfamily N-acetyltransferase
MNLTLVPINKALSKAPFDCGYPELNQYLRQFAFKNDQLSIGKTFLAMTDGHELAGYLTISTAQVAAETLPAVLKAKLPRYPVPAFRIGKLAVDAHFQGSGVGSWLLTHAFQKVVEISQNVGLYAAIVDAIDERAKGFYLKYGFAPFEDHPLVLFIPIATIKAAMV